MVQPFPVPFCVLLPLTARSPCVTFPPKLLELFEGLCCSAPGCEDSSGFSPWEQAGKRLKKGRKMDGECIL